MASKSKRNKIKFKWTKELIFLLVGIVVLIVAAVIINLPTSASVTLEKYNTAISTYNSENSTSYNTLPENHVFKETSLDGLKNTKKSDDYTFVFYGSLKNAQFLENLSNINTIANEYDVKAVYLWFADYVENTDADTKATATYKTKVNEYNAVINENINSLVASSNGLYQSQDNFDLETYPALLVFKSNSLVFNSQTDTKEDFGDNKWSVYISSAFKYAKADELVKSN